MRKVRSIGRIDLRAGISIVEMLVVLGVAGVILSAIGGLVQYTNLSVLEGGFAQTAGYMSDEYLNRAVYDLKTDYLRSVDASTSSGNFAVQTITDPESLTRCAKDIRVDVGWVLGKNPSASVFASSRVVDFDSVSALTHCAMTVPLGGWTNVVPAICAGIASVSPRALEVFPGMVFVGSDTDPFLHIIDIKGISGGVNCKGGEFVSFANGFKAHAPINDIKVARVNDRLYAFCAMHTTPGEVLVVDITDTTNPVALTSVRLKNVSGSLSQAFRLFFYDKKVYVTVREGSVRELHILEASVPALTYEIGSGVQLNTTVEALHVARIKNKLFAFMATDSNLRELLVLDVTDPLRVLPVLPATQNLPGNVDGASLFFVNGFLYFGRESVAGMEPELYLYDVSDPWSGIVLLRAQDIGNGVVSMAVAGKFAFLFTKRLGMQFQVWSSGITSSFVRVGGFYNTGSPVYGGLIYEDPYVYTLGQSVDFLRIFSSQ